MSIFNRHGPYGCVLPFRLLAKSQQMALIYNRFGRGDMHTFHTHLRENQDNFYPLIEQQMAEKFSAILRSFSDRLVIVEDVHVDTIKREITSDPSFEGEFPGFSEYHAWWVSKFGVIFDWPQDPWPLVLADGSSILDNPYEKFAECYDRLHTYIALGVEQIPCVRMLE
jgi:hypothetical protein